jgi:hypothetical protein
VKQGFKKALNESDQNLDRPADPKRQEWYPPHQFFA